MADSYARTIAAASIEPGRVPFDLYATDANDRMALFCRAGFELSERHKKMLVASDRVFYISEADMETYFDYAFERFERIVDSARISVEEKAGIVHGVGKRVVRRFLVRPREEDTLSSARRFIGSFADLVLRSPQTAKYLFAISATDSYTFSHHMNVCTFCLLLGRKLLGDDRERLHAIALGGLLHDIGMTQVDPAIVQKRGPLNEREREAVQQHPVFGDEILSGHGLGTEVRAAVRSHHERFDGSGYPDGLSGDAIAPFASIVAVAEVYDAITSDRLYARQQSQVKALAIMSRESGGFAPDVFEALLRIVLHNEELIEKFRSRGIVARPLSDAGESDAGGAAP